MSQFFPELPPMAPPVETGAVEADVPCRKCAYNLRGLPLDGRCPECGAVVALSIRGDLLRYSDPAFLRTLGRGIQLIRTGAAGMLLTYVAYIILAMNHVILRYWLTLICINMAFWAIFLIGNWLLTVPDPSGLGEDRYGRRRQLVRVMLAIGLFNTMLGWFVRTAGPFTPGLRLALNSAMAIMSFGALVGLLGQLAYLKRLANRIPNPSLSESTGSLMWGLGAPIGIMYTVVDAMTILRPMRPLRGFSSVAAAGCFMAVAFVVAMIFAVRYLLFLRRFGLELKVQAMLADAAWAKASGADSLSP